MDITVPADEITTVYLPGSAAIRIDSRHRVIAVDYVSTMVADAADFAAVNAAADAPLVPEWLVQDLREGTYGDFHQLKPAGECIDVDCAGSGQHATAGERAALRDALT